MSKFEIYLFAFKAGVHVIFSEKSFVDRCPVFALITLAARIANDDDVAAARQWTNK